MPDDKKPEIKVVIHGDITPRGWASAPGVDQPPSGSVAAPEPAEPQPEWIDIPAHRIYQIHRSHLDKFGLYNERGEHIAEALWTLYRAVRKRDGKLFKPAQFWPIDAEANGFFVLEEI